MSAPSTTGEEPPRRQVQLYGTRRELPPLPFAHERLEHLRRDHPRWLTHFHRLVGGLVGGPVGEEERLMTHELYAVIRHLERTRHYLRLSLPAAAFDALASWAWDANAILMLADGAVRDPTGLVLVDPQSGAAEPAATVPFPEEAEQRRNRSAQRLRELGQEPPAVLPPTVGESEAVLRDPAHVARRAMALFVVAVRAESLAAGKPIEVAQLRAKSPLAFESLSSWEANFLNSSAPDEQAIVDAVWRYEALATLQWALRWQAVLPFADKICEVPTVAERMLAADETEMVEQASLRPVSEILDALDFNQRLLAIARQSAHQGEAVPLALEGGILRERQHAFNWLVQFQDAVWDQVDTPT